MIKFSMNAVLGTLLASFVVGGIAFYVGGQQALNTLEIIVLYVSSTIIGVCIAIVLELKGKRQ